MKILPLSLFGLLYCTLIFYNNLSAQEKFKEKTYSVDKYTGIKFQIPDNWKEKVDKKELFYPFTVTFNDPGEKSSKLIISLIPLNESQMDMIEPEKLKASLISRGSDLLRSAVEDSLKLENFSGKNSAGFFYFLTDRAPKPGEYKFVYQGSIGIGNLLSTFTLLTNNRDSDFIDQSFHLLSTGEYIQKK